MHFINNSNCGKNVSYYSDFKIIDSKNFEYLFNIALG